MNICEDCPMRLFNTKHYNLHGIGNPYSGNCIVIPNVDYNAYKKGDMGFSSQVDIIKEVLHLSTGEHDNLIDLKVLNVLLNIYQQKVNVVILLWFVKLKNKDLNILVANLCIFFVI